MSYDLETSRSEVDENREEDVTPVESPSEADETPEDYSDVEESSTESAPETPQETNEDYEDVEDPNAGSASEASTETSTETAEDYKDVDEQGAGSASETSTETSTETAEDYEDVDEQGAGGVQETTPEATEDYQDVEQEMPAEDQVEKSGSQESEDIEEKTATESTEAPPTAETDSEGDTTVTTAETDNEGEPAANAETSEEGDPAANAETSEEGDPAANAETSEDGEPVANAETSEEGEPAATAETDGEGEPAATAETDGEGEPAATAETDGEGDPAANAETSEEGDPAANAETNNEGNPAAAETGSEGEDTKPKNETGNEGADTNANSSETTDNKTTGSETSDQKPQSEQSGASEGTETASEGENPDSAESEETPPEGETTDANAEDTNNANSGGYEGTGTSENSDEKKNEDETNFFATVATDTGSNADDTVSDNQDSDKKTGDTSTTSDTVTTTAAQTDNKGSETTNSASETGNTGGDAGGGNGGAGGGGGGGGDDNNSNGGGGSICPKCGNDPCSCNNGGGGGGGGNTGGGSGPCPVCGSRSCRCNNLGKVKAEDLEQGWGRVEKLEDLTFDQINELSKTADGRELLMNLHAEMVERVSAERMGMSKEEYREYKRLIANGKKKEEDKTPIEVMQTQAERNAEAAMERARAMHEKHLREYHGRASKSRLKDLNNQLGESLEQTQSYMGALERERGAVTHQITMMHTNGTYQTDEREYRRLCAQQESLDSCIGRMRTTIAMLDSDMYDCAMETGQTYRNRGKELSETERKDTVAEAKRIMGEGVSGKQEIVDALRVSERLENSVVPDLHNKIRENQTLEEQIRNSMKQYRAEHLCTPEQAMQDPDCEYARNARYLKTLEQERTNWEKQLLEADRLRTNLRSGLPLQDAACKVEVKNLENGTVAITYIWEHGVDEKRVPSQGRETEKRLYHKGLERRETYVIGRDDDCVYGHSYSLNYRGVGYEREDTFKKGDAKLVNKLEVGLLNGRMEAGYMHDIETGKDRAKLNAAVSAAEAKNTLSTVINGKSVNLVSGEVAVIKAEAGVEANEHGMKTTKPEASPFGVKVGIGPITEIEPGKAPFQPSKDMLDVMNKDYEIREKESKLKDAIKREWGEDARGHVVMEGEGVQLEKHLEEAVNSDRLSFGDVKELRDFGGAKLDEIRQEQDRAREDAQQKFRQVTSMKRGEEGYKEALDQYNAAKDHLESTDERARKMEKMHALLEKRSEALRDAQLEKGAAAADASAATLAAAQAYQNRYDQAFYGKTQDAATLAEIQSSSAATIRELSDQQASIRLAMEAKMDQIQQYVTENGLGRFDTERDPVYQEMIAQYRELEATGKKVGYAAVKLDTNNMTISEVTGEAYTSMLEKKGLSPIREVNDGTDEPGKTNYFVDEVQAEAAFKPFRPGEWEKLNIAEQKAATQNLANYNAQILGVEDKPLIIFYNSPDPTDFGGFSEKQNAIFINEYNMGDALETADTVSHEYRHKYQHERAQRLETERDLAFKENLENYIRPEHDYAGYKRQIVETDAEAYADAVREKIGQKDSGSTAEGEKKTAMAESTGVFVGPAGGGDMFSKQRHTPEDVQVKNPETPGNNGEIRTPAENQSVQQGAMPPPRHPNNPGAGAPPNHLPKTADGFAPPPSGGLEGMSSPPPGGGETTELPPSKESLDGEFIKNNGEVARYTEAVNEMTDEMRSLIGQINATAEETGRPKISEADAEAMIRDAEKAIWQQHEEAKKRNLGDHGIRHIYGNFERTKHYLDQRGDVTAEQKLAAVLAHSYHDLGYCADPCNKGVRSEEYNSDKRHDSASMQMLKENQEQYATIAQALGPTAMTSFERAVQEHNTAKLEDVRRNTAQESDIVVWAVHSSDKMALSQREKLPELLLNHPEVIEMSERAFRIEKNLDDACKAELKGDSPEKRKQIEQENAQLKKELAQTFQNQVKVWISQQNFDEDYKKALVSAVDKDLGANAAKFTSRMSYIQIYPDCMEHISYENAPKDIRDKAPNGYNQLTVTMPAYEGEKLYDAGDKTAGKQIAKLLGDYGLEAKYHQEVARAICPDVLDAGVEATKRYYADKEAHKQRWEEEARTKYLQENPQIKPDELEAKVYAAVQKKVDKIELEPYPGHHYVEEKSVGKEVKKAVDSRLDEIVDTKILELDNGRDEVYIDALLGEQQVRICIKKEIMDKVAVQTTGIPELDPNTDRQIMRDAMKEARLSVREDQAEILQEIESKASEDITFEDYFQVVREHGAWENALSKEDFDAKTPQERKNSLYKAKMVATMNKSRK